MSETSGTDHCQRDDTELGMGMIRDGTMLFKEQKEVPVENQCFFFFVLKCIKFALHSLVDLLKALAFHYPLIHGSVTQNLCYFQHPC